MWIYIYIFFFDSSIKYKCVLITRIYWRNIKTEGYYLVIFSFEFTNITAGFEISLEAQNMLPWFMGKMPETDNHTARSTEHGY